MVLVLTVRACSLLETRNVMDQDGEIKTTGVHRRHPIVIPKKHTGDWPGTS